MYSLLILPELINAIFIEEQLLSEYETKPTITRSPRYNKRNEICDHVKNFSCYHSEQTVFLNGKKQHTKKNMCKCYDCGMEFSN